MTGGLLDFGGVLRSGACVLTPDVDSKDSTWPRKPNDNAFRNAVHVLAKYG
jgi:hypothetical protein